MTALIGGALLMAWGLLLRGPLKPTMDKWAQSLTWEPLQKVERGFRTAVLTIVTAAGAVIAVGGAISLL